MASTAASSSSPAEADRPVIVRVKRKASQSRLDAFWLEISERPTKRPLIDFGKLSISESSPARVEESKSRKVFVQHVETITTPEITVDILQPLLLKSGDDSGAEPKSDTRRAFKTENKHDQLLSKAKKQREIVSKNARFEQIWRSRKEKSESDRIGDLNETFRVYDIVRVEQEESGESDVKLRSEMEECRMMADFLPLLREHLPTAAAEVETDIRNTFTKKAIPDKYVYDYYAVRDGNIVEEKVPSLFPLVRVEDEEFYDGPDDSDEYATDDSNAEDNPLNDYPEEDPSGDESEEASKSSGDESEEGESGSQKSSEHEELELDGHDDSGVDAVYDDDDDDDEDEDF